jgi:hypothetical protein
MASNPASIEICPSCGSPLEKPGLTECPICGFDLTQLEPPPPPQPEPGPESISEPAPEPVPPPPPPVPEKETLEPAPPGKPKSPSRKRHAAKSGKVPGLKAVPALPSLVEQYQALLLEATRLEQTNDLDAALAAYRRALAFAEANRKADISLELAVQALSPLVRRTEQMQAPRQVVALPDERTPKAPTVVTPPAQPVPLMEQRLRIHDLLVKRMRRLQALQSIAEGQQHKAPTPVPVAQTAPNIPPPPAVDTQAQQAALQELTRMSAGKTRMSAGKTSKPPVVQSTALPPAPDLAESAKRLKDYDQVPWLFSKEPVDRKSVV